MIGAVEQRRPDICSPASAMNKGSRPAVVIRGLVRSFGTRKVIENLNLEITEGTFVALLGASGCGKSTLLRILANLDRDIEGDVFVAGRRAVSFQSPRLMPWKRVWRNVVLGLPGRPDPVRARAALAEVGLTRHAMAWPKTLSGGEAQRAALARALARQPDLLLLDEPFAALDALTRIKAQKLVADLWSRHRCAVLLVTHDVEEALLLADRVLVMRDGRIAHDEDVTLARPRDMSHSRFVALRTQLLSWLGVDLAAKAPHTSQEATTMKATDALGANHAARIATIAATIERVREIEKLQGVTRPALEEIKQHLMYLAAQDQLFPTSEYPPPEPGEKDSRLYLLHQDHDGRFALYMNALNPGRETVPHDHTTWAVVAAVEGQELNKVYRRTDDGSQPDRADVVLDHEVIVEPGRGIALMPEDIHSIHTTGQVPTRHLHMYGLALDRLDRRQAYDPLVGSVRPYNLAIPLATAQLATGTDPRWTAAGSTPTS